MAIRWWSTSESPPAGGQHAATRFDHPHPVVTQFSDIPGFGDGGVVVATQMMATVHFELWNLSRFHGPAPA